MPDKVNSKLDNILESFYEATWESDTAEEDEKYFEEAKADIKDLFLELVGVGKKRQLHSSPNNGELMEDFESKGYNLALSELRERIKNL